MNQFKGKDIPMAARRRAWILTVAHVSFGMSDPNIQEIMSKWIAKGELSDPEWEKMRKISEYVMRSVGDSVDDILKVLE